MINVENEQLAKDALDFYSHSIVLIQHYLLICQYISEDRSNYLQSVFADMSFISVDSLSLSYRYKEHLTRKMTSSSILASYIDESTRKFYILTLHNYGKSETRHIDTMVNYLIQDEKKRLQLSTYIRYLFKIYQDDGLIGLNTQRETLPEQQKPRWIIPQVAQETLSIRSEDEDNDTSNEPVSIPAEMLEQLLNEPVLTLPNRNLNSTTDPCQPKTLTCFPAKPSSRNISEPSNPDSPSIDTRCDIDKASQVNFLKPSKHE